MDNLVVKYFLGLGKKDEAVAKGWADFIGEMPTSYAINPLEKVTPYEKDNWWYILRTLFLLFRCDAIVLLKDWDKLGVQGFNSCSPNSWVLSCSTASRMKAVKD